MNNFSTSVKHLSNLFLLRLTPPETPKTPGTAGEVRILQIKSYPSIHSQKYLRSSRKPRNKKSGRSRFLNHHDNRLCGERGPTPTGRCRIWISDHKLRSLQAFAVVDLSTNQILKTHRINQKGHAIFFHGRVVFINFFVERKTILKTRAPATGYKYPQFQTGITLFFNQFLNLACSTICKNKGCRRFSDRGHKDNSRKIGKNFEAKIRTYRLN